MSAATQFIRMLMLVVTAMVAVVPGGLAMNICLCRVAEARGHFEQGCGMPCCVGSCKHERAAQEALTPAHKDCTDCRTIKSGERDASSLAKLTVELPQTAAIITAPAISIIEYSPRVWRRVPRRVNDLAPPGRFTSLPLRI
jgi:hypothetical protein